MPYASLLDEEEIGRALTGIPEWRREGETIVRDLRFPSFRVAIAFVDRVAELAESADHHPDIDIRWRKVRLLLTTHASGGLTRRDFDLAERIEAAVREMMA